ncbi:hypothetical protein BJ944DRAFT_285898 [Cunninghamella echinulata]|nr:hypothetical protein BJ944DRAFT_285898 [Cunninghamella echinulata]
MSQVRIPTHYRSQDMMQELFEEINDYLVDQSKPIEVSTPPVLSPATDSIESEEDEVEVENNNLHEFQLNSNMIDQEKSLYVEEESSIDLQPAMYVESDEDDTSSQIDFTQHNDHHHDNQTICKCYKCNSTNTQLEPPTQGSEEYNNNKKDNKQQRLYRPKSTSSFVAVSSAKLAHIAGLVKQTLSSTPHEVSSNIHTNQKAILNEKQQLRRASLVYEEMEYNNNKFYEPLAAKRLSYLAPETKPLNNTSGISDTVVDSDYILSQHNNNNNNNNEDAMIFNDNYQNTFNSWQSNESNMDETSSYISKTYNNNNDNNNTDSDVDNDNHMNEEVDIDYNELPINENYTIMEDIPHKKTAATSTNESLLMNHFNEGQMSTHTNLPFLTPMHRIGEPHTIHLKTKSARDVGTRDDRMNAYNNAYFHCVMAKTDMIPWIKKQYNKGPPTLIQQYKPTPKKSSKSLFNLFKRHSKSSSDNSLQPIGTFANENMSRLSLSIPLTSNIIQSPTTLSPQPSIHSISSFQQQTDYEIQQNDYQEEATQKTNSLSIDHDFSSLHQLESLRPSPSVSMISTESQKENVLRKKHQKSQNSSHLVTPHNSNKINNDVDTLSVTELQPLKKKSSISSFDDHQPVSILKKKSSKQQISAEFQSNSNNNNNKREKHNINDDFLIPSSESPHQQHRHQQRSRSVSPIPQSALSYRSPSPSNFSPSRRSPSSHERLDSQQQQHQVRRSVSPSPRYLNKPDHQQYYATRQRKNSNSSSNGGVVQPYRSNSNSSMRSTYSNASNHSYIDQGNPTSRTIYRSRSSEHLAPSRLVPHGNTLPSSSKMLEPGNGMVRRRSSSNLLAAQYNSSSYLGPSASLNDGPIIRTRKVSNSSLHSNYQQQQQGNGYCRWSSSATPISGRRSTEPMMMKKMNPTPRNISNRRGSTINNSMEDMYSYDYYDDIDNIDDDYEGSDYYYSSSSSGRQHYHPKANIGTRKWSSQQQQQQLQPMVKMMEKSPRSRSPISRSHSKSSINGFNQALDDLCSFFQHLPRHVLARYLQDAQGDFFLAKDLCMEDIMANGI